MDVEKLIENVRRYPALYHLTNEKYKNTEVREKIWKKIAEDLQVAGGPTECKKKWIHVRDQFRKILKKRKTATGMAAGNVRKYKYEDLLQFILPQMTERETLTNISVSQEEETEDDEDNLEQTQEDDDASNDVSNEYREANNESYKEMICDEEQSTSARDHKKPKRDLFIKPAQNKKKKLAISSQVDNSPSAQLMSYILDEKKKAKQQELPSEPLHPVDAFLNGISHNLKTLNPLQLNEAKTKIFGIVQEIEKSQLLGSHPTAMVHHQVQPFQISQASPSGSTYSTVSPTSSSTPLPSPTYSFPPPTPAPASPSNPTDFIELQPAQRNTKQWY